MTTRGVRPDTALPEAGPLGAELGRWADDLTSRLSGPPAGPLAAWVATSTRAGALVLTRGHVVVKVHRAGTSTEELRQRLAVVSEPGVSVLWAPLLLDLPVPVPATALDGARPATVWRRLDPLDPDAATQPWAHAARLLSRLHRARVAPGGAAAALPPHGGPERLLRAAHRLESRPATASVRAVLAAAVQALGAVARHATPAGRPLTLVHGDWHLGQLGRLDGELRLLDADDLGLGDPAWDLARPAGFWAAGLLDDASWTDFLGGYREADGPAVPGDGDPWPGLDLPARAAVVVAAAAGLGADGLPVDEPAEALIDACTQMARTA